MTHNYTPITELVSADQDPSSALTWDFSLPPSLDAERLEIDLTKISRFQKVGYFSATHVMEYTQDSQQSTPAINGINADGTASAVASKAITITPVQRVHLHDEFRSAAMSNYGKTAGIHELNKDQIVRRVVDAKENTGKSREELWAAQLNDALNQSLAEGAKSHLITRVDIPTRIVSSVAAASYVVIGSQTTQPEVTIPINVAVARFGGLILSYSRAREYDNQVRLANRRMSLFPYFMQPESYLASVAIVKMGKTIRARR